VSAPLFAAPRPCNTCPYRRDTPPGVWHPDEYAKLATFDDQHDGSLPNLAVFRCHQQTATNVPTVCRGWLSVHAHTPAIRMAVITGQVTVDQVFAEVDVELYETGAEACAAGMAGVERVSSQASRAIDKLQRRGVGVE